MVSSDFPLVMERRRRRPPLSPYLFLVPALITMAVLVVYPAAYTLYLSFTNYNLFHFNSFSIVGFKNYNDILNPNGLFFEDFIPVFTWTVVFALSTAILNYVVGFLLAVVLNNPRIPERAIYRTLLIVPYAIPGVITTLVWAGLLDQSFGAVDALLTSLHLPSIPWLTDPTGARAAILMVNLWLSFPFNLILCLGALQAIPADIYEAATVDGASAFDRLRLLTLPLVFRITSPQLVGAFSFNFMNFNIVYLLTAGGPPKVGGTGVAGSTDVLASYVYALTGTSHRYELAAAVGIIIFLIQAVLALFGFWLTGNLKGNRP
ncbi:MAG TPA: sugar ABC transporter permease [Chloroflexota bacterium]|nr:sugar ABC transporter permease [Chloroflexota bacterium]